MSNKYLFLISVILFTISVSVSYSSEPIVIDDFDSYEDDSQLLAVWKDGSTNGTTSEIRLSTYEAHDGNSMEFFELNLDPPYYAEAEANMADLGADPNWLGAKSLSIWFYDEGVDPYEPMYVKLTDSNNPPQTAKVLFNGDPNELTDRDWDEWRIALQEFVDANSSFDLSKVEKIAIGIGDGVTESIGWIYFDDIRLYPERCILSIRTDDFAKVDFAPLHLDSYPGGDCVIDEQELEIMSNTFTVWHPPIHPNLIPDLVAYWPMDEGNGNKIYTDPFDPCYTGTLSVRGVSWETPGVLDINSALRFERSYDINGARVSCGNENPASEANELSLSVWVKWAGSDERPKSQGVISKRNGWADPNVQFMFEVDTVPGPRGTFGLRQFVAGDTDVYAPTGILTQYIGLWVHLAATYDGTDANDACKLYLNGIEVASGPFSFGSNTSAGLTIGNNIDEASWPGSPECFNGIIDEVCIYSRALTQEEIAYLVGYVAKICPPEVIPTPPTPANLYQECPKCPWIIDFKDFAVLSDYWLQDQLWP